MKRTPEQHSSALKAHPTGDPTAHARWPQRQARVMCTVAQPIWTRYIESRLKQFGTR